MGNIHSEAPTRHQDHHHQHRYGHMQKRTLSLHDDSLLHPESMFSRPGQSIFSKRSQSVSPRVRHYSTIHESTADFLQRFNQPSSSPDVESLGIPFNVSFKIFLELSLDDLKACMMVCKELRSLIDTCTFWRAWLKRKYNFTSRDPPSGSLLSALKSRNTSSKKQSSPFLETPFIFKPFPDTWNGEIVVPAGARPPDGNLTVCHQFVKALHWTSLVLAEVKSKGLSKQLHVCLFHWNLQDRMPTGKEVLDVFNAHEDIIQSSSDTRELTKDELRSNYQMVVGKGLRKAFDKDMFNCIAAKVGRMSIVCQCSETCVKPTPCFLLTRVASCWVGGILYSKSSDSIM